MPSVDRLLTQCLALALGLSFWSISINDPDLGFHLLGGWWVAEHGFPPRMDFINALNEQWVDYHWLGQFMMYLAYTSAGFWGLKVYVGISIACLLLILIEIVHRSRHRHFLFPTMLTILFCSYLLNFVAAVRPHIVALLVLALALKRMMAVPRNYDLIVMFLCTAALANIHVYWLFVPVLWICYRTLPQLVLAKRNVTPSCLLSPAVIALAGLASPYGTRNIAVVADYLTMGSHARSSIQELRGALSADIGLSIVVVLVLVVVAVLTPIWHMKRSPGQYAFLFISAVLVFLSVKFVGVFAIAMVPPFHTAIRRIPRKFGPIVARGLLRCAPLLTGALILIGAYQAFTAFPHFDQSKDLQRLNQHFPIQVCSQIALASSPEIRKRYTIMTHFNHGSWCRWAMHVAAPDRDMRVTMDGRSQFVPERRILESLAAYAGRAGWETTIESLNPDWIVVANSDQLNSLLLTSTRWKREFSDHGFSVYR